MQDHVAVPQKCCCTSEQRLKLQVDDGEVPSYFLCPKDCTFYKHNLLSLYPNAVCKCGQLMDRTIKLSDAQDRGVFVKGRTQFIISDELQVKPSSIEASLSVVSKLGLMDFSAVEEYNIDIGVDQELDAEKYLKSNEHKEMLISPKLAPDFSHENNPLGIEEGLHPTYCVRESYSEPTGYYFQLTSDGHIPSGSTLRSSILTVKGPKSHFKEATRGGFVTGPTMFTVTDNLVITPMSQVQSLSLLKELKVSVSDIEERVVHVGSEKVS
ncbi:hypothetical protein Pint_32636 [Pistacia integerrima]|uniref:Uncharacterized protein n=1 Tax=Pistacia integerrima TaxID=434235 RepID=A0ACC0XQU8_9ROSI|nr:hypothetical protein Pint_32636 [Pistacia integerrima]